MWVNGRTSICPIANQDGEELVQFYTVDADFFFWAAVKSILVHDDNKDSGPGTGAALTTDPVPVCDLDPNAWHPHPEIRT